MTYDHPIDIPRPPGASRFEAWSPKLRRRVSLYSAGAFDQWLLLEADPGVVAFCERPYRAVLDGGRRLVDFWVRGESGDFALLLVGGPEDRAGLAAEAADSPGPELRRVAPIDLMAKAQLVANWRMILPYLTANGRFVTPALLLEVARALAEPRPLAELEQRLGASYEPMLVRTGVFELLRCGRAVAPSLAEAPLGPRTVFGGV